MAHIDIIDICHCRGRPFDEIMATSSEDDMVVSYSFEDFLMQKEQTTTTATAENDNTTRCISVDSEGNASVPSSPVSKNNRARAISIDSTPQHNTGPRTDDVFDTYDILPTILGTGNYGTVRECLHRSTGEKYAIKTIDKSKVTRLDHIQREIELLGRVDHKGIMKMVDCYEDADCVHIITEMCTGGELFDKIIDNTTDFGCLREKEAMRIIKSLLESVDYLHENDIVHRDIKPENVLFESSERGSAVKLIDFGLSRTHAQNEGCMTNQVGTPYYMSPGVLSGTYDRSCDLWAVGIVAYIMLAGYPPFNGNSDPEIHDAVLRGNLVFERGVWGHLSVEARDFVSKLLCTDESSRIGSAKEALRHSWVR